MAFVLIQHLDPNHETLIPELLIKYTTMPVQRVLEPVQIEANHVYVIPANALLTMEKCVLTMERCVLQISRPGSPMDRMPIDHFLRSVAEDQRQNLVAIILSGIGVDGTLGLKAVKEHGGMTIAQSLETAKYDSMPRSAISTGLVDHILAVEQMPGRIIEYVRHLEALERKKGAAGLHDEVAKAIKKIVPILRRKTGHDFSRYKESTLVRRIQRRMQVLYFDSVNKYVDCLQRDLKEVDNLFKDLLIGVTQFFRDPEAFEALALRVIPEIFRDKPADGQVRAWITGCASGEEAYSIAILMAEHAAKLESAPHIQIFATDLDEQALDAARKGIYPEHIAEQLTPERLQRFFCKRGSSFEVVPEIREMCVFSPHNLIKDPPFSRQDLISCRNLLIYLEAELQRKLLPVFHYALNPSGFLFLGPSENVASRSELFRAVEKKQRIFQRKPGMLRSELQVPMMEPGRVTRLQPLASNPILNAGNKEQSVIRTIERVVLEDYAPASVIINEQGEIVYFSGRTGKFLEPATGVPSNKLINMARRSLRLELRTTIHRAISTRQETVRENIVVKIGSEVRLINLIVRPVAELGKEAGLFIVLFQELVPATGPGHLPVAGQEVETDNPIVQQLENELRTTKEDLQTTIEELETSNEELKSANEELLSMNEELQSTNEELQTSKEELQSLNDELQRKLEELDTASADQNLQRAELAAIVEGSEDAIIGKSLDGMITSWNTTAERMFGYTAAEAIGQSISLIVPSEKLPELRMLFERVKRGERVESFETVRMTKAGQRLIVSFTLSPIYDPRGRMVGISGIERDITQRRSAEELLKQSEERLAAVVEHMPVMLQAFDEAGRIVLWNAECERITGYLKGEIVTNPLALEWLYPDETYRLRMLAEWRLKGNDYRDWEWELTCKDGSKRSILWSNISGRVPVSHWASWSIGVDVTQEKKAEKALAEAKDRLSRHATDLEKQVAERTRVLKETVQSLEGVCYTIAHDLRAPLRSLQGFTRILLEDYASAFDNEGRLYAERIGAAATRMDVLIRDLLDYARLSHLDLPLSSLDLEHQVRQVLSQLASEIDAANAEVLVSPLPRALGNETVLNQVLTNLVTNALKFIPPKIRPKIEISAQSLEEKIRLSIRDNGIGIDTAHHERIFGLFQRLHKSESYPGTGIGLAIVRKGMERMGGTVGVDSSPGAGSCFYIDLRLPSQ